MRIGVIEYHIGTLFYVVMLRHMSMTVEFLSCLVHVLF
nr:MAG TPA: hypothetical protein [Caudoviricetes sp.]